MSEFYKSACVGVVLFVSLACICSAPSKDDTPEKKKNREGAAAFFFVMSGVAVLSIVVVTGVSYARNRCLFGHRRKWVAVHDVKLGESWQCRSSYCPGNLYGWHSWGARVQIGRWVCAREGCCGMGEHCLGDLSKGIYTVQHGELIPDEKRWVNER